MISMLLIYIGSGVIFLWGLGHLFATKSVIAGFGELTSDNWRIIKMEWIVEGLTLCFIGALVFLTILFADLTEISVTITIVSSAVMLLILAVVSSFLGARTAILPMKLCPVVKTICAAMMFTGLLL